MAFKDPNQSEVSSSYYAVFINGKGGIGRTCGHKTTGGYQEGRYYCLVEFNYGYYMGSGFKKRDHHFLIDILAPLVPSKRDNYRPLSRQRPQYHTPSGSVFYYA